MRYFFLSSFLFSCSFYLIFTNPCSILLIVHIIAGCNITNRKGKKIYCVWETLQAGSLISDSVDGESDSSQQAWSSACTRREKKSWKEELLPETSTELMSHIFKVDGGRIICESCGDERGVNIERPCPFHLIPGMHHHFCVCIIELSFVQHKISQQFVDFLLFHSDRYILSPFPSSTIRTAPAAAGMY